MRLYFVRHGESQANLLHEISNRGLRHGLTRRGRVQATALADRLRPARLARIYSSPVLRAIETSVILAQQLDLDYEVVDALREYDCGALEGRADEAAWQGWRALFEAWTVHGQWDSRSAGGESLIEIRDRFLPFTARLVAEFGESDAGLVCVSHGGLLRLMLPLLIGDARFDLDYTACVAVEWRAAGFSLMSD